MFVKYMCAYVHCIHTHYYSPPLGFIVVKPLIVNRIIRKKKRENNLVCAVHICNCSHLILGFPGGSVAICLPSRRLGLRSLSREDPLEQEMATHSSIVA